MRREWKLLVREYITCLTIFKRRGIYSSAPRLLEFRRCKSNMYMWTMHASETWTSMNTSVGKIINQGTEYSQNHASQPLCTNTSKKEQKANRTWCKLAENLNKSSLKNSKKTTLWSLQYHFLFVHITYMMSTQKGAMKFRTCTEKHSQPKKPTLTFYTKIWREKKSNGITLLIL